MPSRITSFNVREAHFHKRTFLDVLRTSYVFLTLDHDDGSQSKMALELDNALKQRFIDEMRKVSSEEDRTEWLQTHGQLVRSCPNFCVNSDPFLDSGM